MIPQVNTQAFLINKVYLFITFRYLALDNLILNFTIGFQEFVSIILIYYVTVSTPIHSLPLSFSFPQPDFFIF